MTLSDTSFTTSTAKADALNQFFASVFHSNSNNQCFLPSIIPGSSITFTPVSIEEVLSLLSALSVWKATGPDGISARLLKECAEVIAPSLTELFNKSLTLGKAPTEWKHANIVPVPKTNETRVLATTVRYPYYPLCQRSLSMWSTPEPSVLSNHYFTLNNMDFAHEDPASPSFLMLYTILAKH